MTTSYNVDTLKDINLKNVGIGELKKIAQFLDIKPLYKFNNGNKDELIKLVDEKINKNDTKQHKKKKTPSPKGKALLPCPNPDQERNLDTGKCRKKCTPEQERNSAGKCVKRKAPQKRQKRQKTPPKKTASPKGKTLLPCPNPDQERNLDTGKCRKKCTPEQERNYAGKCVKRKATSKRQKKPQSPPKIQPLPSPSKIPQLPSPPKIQPLPSPSKIPQLPSPTKKTPSSPKIQPLPSPSKKTPSSSLFDEEDTSDEDVYSSHTPKKPNTPRKSEEGISSDEEEGISSNDDEDVFSLPSPTKKPQLPSPTKKTPSSSLFDEEDTSDEDVSSSHISSDEEGISSDDEDVFSSPSEGILSDEEEGISSDDDEGGFSSPSQFTEATKAIRGCLGLMY